ncbi:MAG TPA: outer membrane lipoprotein-sorting protein, partial [Anaerolineaceae bacterium]|nr:outer membrane lipoprotein-sorting protein [Anaerolineaceae bacterium]
MRLRTVGRMLAVVVALAAFSGTAQAETAAEILVKMDKTVNGFDDQFMDNTMTIINIDGSKKSYRFSILQKGEKRLIRFSTGEMKGMANLIEGAGRVYAYLPGQKKVRRVSAHNMQQSFAGSDFSNDDMAFTSW